MRVACGDCVVGAPEQQECFDAVLRGGDSDVLQPHRCRAGPVLGLVPLERPAAPQRQRRLEGSQRERRITAGERSRPVGGERLELFGVVVVGAQREHVTALPREQRRVGAGAEEVAQPPHVGAQCAQRVRFAIVRPHHVDQAVGGHHRVGVHHQQREQLAQSRRRELDRGAIDHQLDRAEDVDPSADRELVTGDGGMPTGTSSGGRRCHSAIPPGRHLNEITSARNGVIRLRRQVFMLPFDP